MERIGLIGLSFVKLKFHPFSQGLRFPGFLRYTDLKSERASGQQDVCLSQFLSIFYAFLCAISGKDMLVGKNMTSSNFPLLC